VRQKCDCGFIRRTCVALNSEFILSIMSASGKCFKRRLFNMADENTERRRTLILRQIVRQWNEKEKADNRAVYVAICAGCIGSRMAKFLLFLWRENIYACSYINMMYALDSTRQKFDVWIGVAFLSDNATWPVERAAEMRQPNQKSNFCRI